MFLKIVLFTSPKYDLANLRKFERLEDSKLCTLNNYASGFFFFCILQHVAYCSKDSIFPPFSSVHNQSFTCMLCQSKCEERHFVWHQRTDVTRCETVWSIQRQHILVVAESYSCEISQGQRRMQNAQTSVYCLSYGKGKQMCVFL